MDTSSSCSADQQRHTRWNIKIIISRKWKTQELQKNERISRWTSKDWWERSHFVRLLLSRVVPYGGNWKMFILILLLKMVLENAVWMLWAEFPGENCRKIWSQLQKTCKNVGNEQKQQKKKQKSTKHLYNCWRRVKTFSQRLLETLLSLLNCKIKWAKKLKLTDFLMWASI